MRKNMKRLVFGVVLGCTVLVPMASPASAATYDSTGDAWSVPLLTGCRTRAKATVTPSGSSRTVAWYTSVSCNRTIPYMKTTMTVSSGYPLNVVQGPTSAECSNCSFVEQSGSYTTSTGQLHYLTGAMRVYEVVGSSPNYHGAWTPAPLSPCTPTVWNYLLYPGYGDCVTNTNFLT